MQVFTNKFNVAMNQEKTEVIINFFQNTPIIPTESSHPNEAREMLSEVTPVANLVMTGQFAQHFVNTLSNLLSQGLPEG